MKTAEEYREWLRSLARKKSSKFRNVRSGGYDSRKEHGRALQLARMAQRGEITDLKEQPRFLLIPTQRDLAGKVKEKACFYVADFSYRTADGRLVVEDVKGVQTDVFKLKKKLMLAVHGIEIKIT